MFDWFNQILPKDFLFFVSEYFASWKKARNIYTRMLEFAFPREDVVD